MKTMLNLCTKMKGIKIIEEELKIEGNNIMEKEMKRKLKYLAIIVLERRRKCSKISS